MAKRDNTGSRPKVATLPGRRTSARLQDYLTEPGPSAKLLTRKSSRKR